MPNVGLSHLSDHLLFFAVLGYALAMLGYSAEFAFGRRWAASAAVGAAASAGRAARQAADVPLTDAALTDAALSDAAQADALAGATTGAARAAGSAGGSSGGVALLERPAGTGADSAVLLIGPDGHARSLPEHPDGGRAGRRTQQRQAQRDAQGPAAAQVAGRAAVALTVLGWVCHVGSVTSRGLAAHRVPWGNMYEFSSMIALVAVSVFLVLLTRARVRYLGAFVMVPVVLYLGLAGTVLYAPAGPLVPALNSYWLKIHVTAAITSSGLFIVGAVVTALYLVRQRYERLTAANLPPRYVGLGRALPASGTLDTLAYRIIAFTFPLWTFAVIAGAIWAEAAWGRYWGWDPKETWSFITWVIYAGYLHARATAGWKGRKAATVALVGFAALAFDFYCVNIWISGLHSYAGV